MLDYAGTRAGSAARARRERRTEATSLVRRLDWLLLGGVAGLVAYGLWAIGGITRADVPGDPDYFVVRQAVFAALGSAAALAALLIDPDVYRRWRRLIYGSTVVLIGLVYVLGTVTRGSKRWLDVGFTEFQPSEFGKLFFVLALAGFLADRRGRVGEGGTVLAAVGLALVPIGLVFLQPDFGTALVYGAALAGVLLVAGTRWVHLAVLGAVALVGAVAILWVLPALDAPLLKPYQTARLTAFTDPGRDPGNLTYNLNQSKLAVGAGGLRGRGVENSTQTNFDYLPEHRTDFAFASLAEQRGFLGASVLLCLYLLVLWRGLRIIPSARDSFAAIVAGGIVFALLFQLFVNIGMTMGIAPITGIPLPFVSVGGSSMIANLLAVGVLQSIAIRGRGSARA